MDAHSLPWCRAGTTGDATHDPLKTDNEPPRQRPWRISCNRCGSPSPQLCFEFRDASPQPFDLGERLRECDLQRRAARVLLLESTVQLRACRWALVHAATINRVTISPRTDAPVRSPRSPILQTRPPESEQLPPVWSIDSAQREEYAYIGTIAPRRRRKGAFAVKPFFILAARKAPGKGPGG